MVVAEVGRLLNAAVAQNTHKTYQVAWKSFCGFKQQPMAGSPSASVADVRHYIAWLSLRGFAPSTIATYVAGVGFFHKMSGGMDPTRDFLVSKLIEGAKRGSPVQDSRVPISVPILLELVSALPHVCSSRFEAVLFRAVFSCAFFGFMRVGEFAVSGTQSFSGGVLAMSDVQFCDMGTPNACVQLAFRLAKNNQCGPPQFIRLASYKDRSICPVQALLDFMAVRPHIDGPVFCHFDCRPLTRYQFNTVLRKAVDFAGFSRLHIRGHSFRIGAASTAASLGSSESEIRQMGRWRSDPFLSYIRPISVCALNK